MFDVTLTPPRTIDHTTLTRPILPLYHGICRLRKESFMAKIAFSFGFGNSSATVALSWPPKGTISGLRFLTMPSRFCPPPSEWRINVVLSALIITWGSFRSSGCEFYGGLWKIRNTAFRINCRRIDESFTAVVYTHPPFFCYQTALAFRNMMWSVLVVSMFPLISD